MSISRVRHAGRPATDKQVVGRQAGKPVTGRQVEQTLEAFKADRQKEKKIVSVDDRLLIEGSRKQLFPVGDGVSRLVLN